MAKIVLYGVNLADKTGSIVTVGGAAAGFPKENAYDRHVGHPWTDTSSTAPRVFDVDQGGGSQAIDSLIVGAGHNLTGVSVTLQSGNATPGDTSQAGPFFPLSSAAFALHAASPYTHRYHRMALQAPIVAAPSIPEVFFSLRWTAPFEISEPGSTEGRKSFRETMFTRTGAFYGAKQGETVWKVDYLIRDIPLSSRLALEQFHADIGGGASPFFISDADGVIRFVVLLNELEFHAVPVYRFDVHLELQEVQP
jgi:hypothetical protein